MASNQLDKTVKILGTCIPDAEMVAWLVYMSENPPVGLHLTESEEERQARKDKEKKAKNKTERVVRPPGEEKENETKRKKLPKQTKSTRMGQREAPTKNWQHKGVPLQT